MVRRQIPAAVAIAGLTGVAMALAAGVFLAIHYCLALPLADQVAEEQALAEAEKTAAEVAVALANGNFKALNLSNYLAVWVYDADANLLYATSPSEPARFFPRAKPGVVFREPGKMHLVVPIRVQGGDLYLEKDKTVGYLYVLCSTYWYDRLKSASLVLLGGSAAASFGASLAISLIVFKIASVSAGKFVEKLSGILRINEVGPDSKIQHASWIREIQVVTDAYNAAIDRLIQLGWTNRALIESLAKKAEENIQSRNALAAAVAHELRTPMTIVGGKLEAIFARLSEALMYKAEITPGLIEWALEELAEAKETHRAQFAHVRHVLEALLGKGSAHPSRFCVLSWSQSLRSVAEALLPEHKLRFPDPVLETKTFCSDVAKINQIALILLENVKKHVPVSVEAGVRIRCTPDELTLSVWDAGSGIADDRQIRIFEAIPAIGEGSLGLGLILASSLAREIHGRLRVESRVGEGACFTLHAPNLEKIA